MSTPHINAKKEDVASIVLMPGDPLRAKYIADTFLKNVKKINNIRNMFMYTGEYKGKKISICGSGMGVPSMGIYSYELFKFYNVDVIIRIGSSGAYTDALEIHDVVLVTESYSDSKIYSQLMTNIDSHISYPSKDINEKLRASAKKQKINLYEVRTHTTDAFYSKRPLSDTLKITEAKCVEMESSGLFINAEVTGKKAACLLSISDHLLSHRSTSPEERQTTFNDMIKIALETI